MGADYIIVPYKDVTLRLGPRLSIGDTQFTSTYFGVTAAESAASGLVAYAPKGGLYSAGVEIGVEYSINDKWGLNGTVRYDRMLGDARNSPITKQGSADPMTVTLMVERRFSTLLARF
jgi:outer membrane scaffolding protein for murein synthesis (MipA/OmpV family)